MGQFTPPAGADTRTERLKFLSYAILTVCGGQSSLVYTDMTPKSPLPGFVCCCWVFVFYMYFVGLGDSVPVAVFNFVASLTVSCCSGRAWPGGGGADAGGCQTDARLMRF
ncbi:hypothetical protein BaRGS_00005664 [Batillaria attramentaria]|uniref:Uncharacterized protein n=1 Tax=Batillaria attramentaria TaxID=370345 RepID=A0ABD0LV07_9CAEN